jgi:glycosyltransferase involved in cell wall biosynthesis
MSSSATAGNDAALTLGMSLLTQAPDQFTGTASYVRGLLREFARPERGISVHGLCNEHALRAFGDCASAEVRLAAVPGFRIGTSRAMRAMRLARSLVQPARVTRQFAPEVSVVHYPLTLGVPWTDLPTVLSLHDVQHHDLPHHFTAATRLARRILYDAPARRATFVVALSEHAKRRIIDTAGVAEDRIVVIPLAADQTRFRPGPRADDEELVARLALPQRYVFYPATLWPHKNHIGLVDALARIDDDLHLVLCGASFGRLDAVLAAAAQRGVEHRVRHLGFVSAETLPVIYRRAAALVFPSTYEGFGAPILEAMASGCPVASSMAGPLAEICAGAAAVLEPDDPAQMAKAISAVTSDEPLRLRLRAAGLQRAGEYSWSRSAQAHLDVYRRAVEH